jgi:hypothetical protein
MNVGGGAPRTPSGVDYMRAGKQSALYEHKLLLRPVVGLAENLPKIDLERITIEAIRTHRRLRDEAEALERSYSEPKSKTADTVGASRLAWVNAMIHMHTQQTLLSTLLDVLGYIPEVPGDEPRRQLRSG